MTCQPGPIPDDPVTRPSLPRWVPSGRAETAEIVAFRSGAALMALDGLLSDPAQGVPARLLAGRLALTAAAATSNLEGRRAREGDIRDAFHLTPPGGARGPDGDLLAYWRGAVRPGLARPGGRAALGRLVGPELGGEVGTWLGSGAARARRLGPLAGCVSVLRAVLAADGRAERAACLLADVMLAQSLNWSSVLPVSAQRLTRALLRALAAGGQGAGGQGAGGQGAEAAELAVQARMLESVEAAIRLARDLARAAAALRAVAPKLRAKGSAAAAALFLGEECVAPATMLSPRIQGTGIAMTDRAARRFCDRLVELGVARELTGRPTFRLYGL